MLLERIIAANKVNTSLCTAAAGQGVQDVREYLLGHAAPGQWTVEAGLRTDASVEEIACEIVREKIFRAYYDGASGSRKRG